jgi:hypothetical protein
VPTDLRDFGFPPKSLTTSARLSRTDIPSPRGKNLMPEFPNRNASESPEHTNLRRTKGIDAACCIRLPPTTPSALHIGRHFPRWLCQATGTGRRSASTERLAGVSLRGLERRVLPSKRPSPYATYADTTETKVVSSRIGIRISGGFPRPSRRRDIGAAKDSPFPMLGRSSPQAD